MSCQESYCRGTTNQPRSMNASPYSYSDSSDVPQLPNLGEREWYLNRNQLPPPEIGFKLEILNFANEEHGSAPYPEADKFPMQPGKPSFPSGGVNTLSGSSTTPLTDYGDYDNFGSGVEDEEHTPNSLKEMRIIIPSRPYRGDEDLHFLPQNVVRIQERRHQPVVDGRENRSRIPSVHHHTRASRKVKENLHDRSGDGFCQYNG